MSKVAVYKCDVCHKEKRPSGHWEDEPSTVKVLIPGGAIQKKLELEDACPSCGRAISDAVNAVLAKLSEREIITGDGEGR